MRAPRSVEVKCEACGGTMKVRVGKKEDAFHATCSCGQGWDYSCWVIKKTEDKVFTKFEGSPCSGGTDCVI